MSQLVQFGHAVGTPAICNKEHAATVSVLTLPVGARASQSVSVHAISRTLFNDKLLLCYKWAQLRRNLQHVFLKVRVRQVLLCCRPTADQGI